MADIVVETGAGLTNSNSYCSVDEADVYHENRLQVSSWSAATETIKETALVWATRLIDEGVAWKGYRTTDAQALMWPRTLVYDREGYTFDSYVIPSWLKNATAEYARNLVDEDRTAETNRDLTGFKKLEIGDLKLTVDSYAKKPQMPVAVWTQIRFYCHKVGAQRTLVRM